MTNHSEENIDNMHGHGKSVWDYTFNLQFLSNLKPDLAVEFGVWKGSTFQILQKYAKKAIGIDNLTWTEHGEYHDKWPKEWDIRIMDSKDVTAKDFQNEKINFGHIDAAHDFVSVIKDFEKMRDNLALDGIICIDDYITHRDVFTATNYFLRENRKFTLKFKGYNQAFIARSEGAKLIDDVLGKFDKKTRLTLKIENTYSMNIIPREFNTDTNFLVKTQTNISDDLKKFYREFNR
jgi:hypothetical protein|tara:strand:- start:44 stop:748 length:705 start_codon:yes stop_codon:yes gene_type:complete